MFDHNRKEYEQALGSALRRLEEQERLPGADDVREVRFSADYCARREEILRCGGRPETACGPWRPGSAESRNDAILREAFTAYCEAENPLPSAEALAGVAFSKAYEKRKKQILRAKGRPAEVKVLRSRKGRRVLRVGLVAALLAVVVMTSVFSNPNGERNLAGFDINIDSYFGRIDPVTDEYGAEAQNPSEVYIQQPDGTRRLPERYEPTYIPADYPLDEHNNNGSEYYIYRKQNAGVLRPEDYITFDQYYPRGTRIFYLEDTTLEEIEVEGLGKCLYQTSKNKRSNSRSIMWRKGPYVFQIHASNLSKDELLKIAKSTKLREN